MADRATLHIHKAGKFYSFMYSKGYRSEATKGPYEYMRFTKEGFLPVIIFKKLGAKEHLSVQDKDHELLEEFLML